MASTITGPDPAQTVWPVKLVPKQMRSGSTSTTYVGGTDPVVILKDGSDSTYLSQGAYDKYWRLGVTSVKLPLGARVSSFRPVVRGRSLVNAGASNRNIGQIFQGDLTGPKYAGVDHAPGSTYPIGLITFRNYAGPSFDRLSNGQLATQADLDRGLVVGFGLITAYGFNSQNMTADWSEAYVQLTYDMAPTATVTGPAPGGTISDTAAPLITWDYSDDFQPQAAYAVEVYTSGGVRVYQSGVVQSSDTSHQMTVNLPNGTYSVRVLVYQAWSGPGGVFPALAPATGTFTVFVLRLGVPRISAVVNGEQCAVTVNSDVNLLNLDDSSFDKGALPLSTNPTNATITADTGVVLNGAGSVKATLTAATGTVRSRQGLAAASPLSPYNALIYVRSNAGTGKTGTLTLTFRDAAGNSLGTASSAATSLPAGVWTPLVVINGTSPAGTVALDYSIALAGTSGDVFNIDNAGVWPGGATARTNLNTNPSFETNSTGYAATGSATPTIALIGTDAFSGTQCLKVTATGPNSLFPGVAGPTFTTVVGVTYTLSAWVKLPVAGSVSTSSVVGYVPGASFTNTVTVQDTWARVSVTFVASATSHSLNLAFSDPALATGQYFYTDAWLYEQAGSALDYFDGSSPAASWTGTANASTSTKVSSFPAWSRGGFFENTPNLLGYDDSSFEGDGWTWAAGTNSTVAVTAAQGLHGARSLAVTAVAATASMTAVLGSRYFSCTAGETIYLFAAAKAAATARPWTIGLAFYTAAGVAVSTQTQGANDATTGWTTAGGGVTVPATATQFQVVLQVNTASGTLAANEVHWFDALAVYRSAYYQAYVPGAFANTDLAPTIVVEYSEDQVTWKELTRTLATYGQAANTFYDYSNRSGVPRYYRAWLFETENSLYLESDYASPVGVTVTLVGVWVSSDANPVGTSTQFKYDGAGRSFDFNANGQQIQLDGQPYDFAEFGSDYDGNLAVTVQLPDATSQQRLLFLAGQKAQVVVRDQRGRSYRGLMGKVQFTDEVWGQSANWQLALTGTQP